MWHCCCIFVLGWWVSKAPVIIIGGEDLVKCTMQEKPHDIAGGCSVYMRLRSLCLFPRANTESRISIVSLPSARDARESSWIILSNIFLGVKIKNHWRNLGKALISGNPLCRLTGTQLTFCHWSCPAFFWGRFWGGTLWTSRVKGWTCYAVPSCVWLFEWGPECESERFTRLRNVWEKPFPKSSKKNHQVCCWQTGVEIWRNTPVHARVITFFLLESAMTYCWWQPEIRQIHRLERIITPGMGWPNSWGRYTLWLFFFRDSYNVMS